MNLNVSYVTRYCDNRSGVVSVCSGDHLKLFICTVTDPGLGSYSILLWNVTDYSN